MQRDAVFSSVPVAFSVAFFVGFLQEARGLNGTIDAEGKPMKNSPKRPLPDPDPDDIDDLLSPPFEITDEFFVSIESPCFSNGSRSGAIRLDASAGRGRDGDCLSSAESPMNVGRGATRLARESRQVSPTYPRGNARVGCPLDKARCGEGARNPAHRNASTWRKLGRCGNALLQ